MNLRTLLEILKVTDVTIRSIKNIKNIQCNDIIDDYELYYETLTLK